MLSRPRVTKYAKVRRGSLPKVDALSYMLKFGSVGLLALESGMLNFNQLEACRKVISRMIKRKGKVWIRVFPDYPFTAKPISIRMGRGKGKVDVWVARISKGKVLFEVDGVVTSISKKALIAAKKKLPLKTLVIEDLE